MPLRPEAVNPTSGRPVTRPILTQSWTDLTYLHWPYEPATVRPFLPPGVEPYVSDGATWVGLIPFAMRRVAVLGARLPYVSDFLETNVRLYGVDAAGRRSVVFLSLDADRLLAVAGARAAYRLPYVWSSMDLRRHDDQGHLHHATTDQRGALPHPRPGRRRRRGRAARPLPPGPLGAAQLVLRRHRLRPHRPPAVAAAQRRAARARRRADRGQRPPAPEGPPRVLHSTGVDVRIGRPVRMDQAH